MAVQTLRRNKGSELTHDELDDNFVFVDEQLAGKAAAGHTHSYRANFGLAGELAVTTGEARFYPPAAGTISSYAAWVGVAPVGADVVAVVKKNGASIATITIPAGTTGPVSGALAVAVLTTDYLTVDCTQTGVATKGSHLNIRLEIA